MLSFCKKNLVKQGWKKPNPYRKFNNNNNNKKKAAILRIHWHVPLKVMFVTALIPSASPWGERTSMYKRGHRQLPGGLHGENRVGYTGAVTSQPSAGTIFQDKTPHVRLM